MTVYLTFNDLPSGIYSGQVIDVIKFIHKTTGVKIKLISFLSLRSYFKNRNIIKSDLFDSMVIPMFPGIQNWRFNIFLLKIIFWFLKPDKIIARGIIATNIALISKSRKYKVIYDARGAISAEWKEYSVVASKRLLKEVDILEKKALFNSDFRMLISNQLLEYYRKYYGYKLSNQVVIPCTLSNYFTKPLDSNIRANYRNKLHYSDSDFILVYSGSVAGWQSFDLLEEAINKIFIQNSNCKVLFLGPVNPHLKNKLSKFNERITFLNVNTNNVHDYLQACDMGLLLRETSITNRVASPVKFAEYLSSGLPVLISENIGDFSNFVLEHNCGIIYNSNDIKVNQKSFSRHQMKEISNKYFTKETYLNSYKTIIAI